MGSPGDCVKVFLALTQAERHALKAVAAGRRGTVNLVQLGKFKSLDLIDREGRNLTLTANGQAVVAFVHQLHQDA
jgi:hypothetical protein